MKQLSSDELMKVFGTQELVKVFEEFSYELQSKILATSFRKASKIIISKAQENLGGKYKKVSNSFTSSFRKEIQTLNVGASKRRGGHLAHIAEAGTVERQYTTKSGKIHRTGKITGLRYWERANIETEKEVENTIYNEMKVKFDRILKRNNKQK